MTRKRYYPNKWRIIKNAPEEAFEPLDFDDFMDWKIAGWRIPDAVLCIIREEDPKTGKVKEFTYKREHAARKKHMKSWTQVIILLSALLMN